MQLECPYNGIFLHNDGSTVGHLNIAGKDSFAKLIGKAFWKRPETEYIDIHGALSNGKKASLLECVFNGRTQHRYGKNAKFETTFFPNYVAVGEEFIRSDEPVIRAIHYHFENVDSLLRGHKSFMSLDLTPEEARKILEADHERSGKIAQEHGWTMRPFDSQIGEHPHLLYFSGVWEIIACKARIGKVSLVNRTSHRMGSAAGIGIDNQVTAVIEFVEPKTLNAAIHWLYTLHSLFELSLGHRQRYRWIKLELTHRVKDDERDIHQTAQLHWSMCNERVEGDSRTSFSGVLLAPDRRPEEFSKVVTGWMNSAPVMSDPRERFATAFFGRFGINRIVGAANMFDLLPESHAPRKKELDDPLNAAVDQCRKIFYALPDSFAKQSVLSALGRVGTASLRDKIRHRADKIVALVGEKFPDLYLPCDHAVLCRNHYVHGSTASFDYKEHFTEFAFITDTLEFVFAVSDLIGLGWDLKSWMSEGPSMTHAFGAYMVNYPENIRRLKALVDA